MLGEYSEGKATRNRALAVYKSGALRSVNTFLYDRPGGAIRAAPTDLGSDVRPGGAICAAPAGFPHVVSWSSCFSSALAGVTPVPRR